MNAFTLITAFTNPTPTLTSITAPDSDLLSYILKFLYLQFYLSIIFLSLSILTLCTIILLVHRTIYRALHIRNHIFQKSVANQKLAIEAEKALDQKVQYQSLRIGHFHSQFLTIQNNYIYLSIQYEELNF